MKVALLTFSLILSSSIFAAANQEAAAEEVPPDYIIGVEDILAISVWREPELSIKEIAVRPDGKISFPIIGDITASGLSPMQLQDLITEKLKEFVASPTVTVVVMRIGSRYVSIVGKVAKPGIYYLGAPMSVLELLARAGGILEGGKEKDISIVRKEGSRNIRFRFNYKDVSKGKNLKQNIDLRNGDVVIVP